MGRFVLEGSPNGLVLVGGNYAGADTMKNMAHQTLATSGPSISTRLHNDRPARLVVSGEIDLSTVTEFDRAVGDAVSVNPRLIIDITGVRYCSCGGVRVLYNHLDSLAAVLIASPSTLAHALSTVGFPRLVLVPPAGAPSQRCRSPRRWR